MNRHNSTFAIKQSTPLRRSRLKQRKPMNKIRKTEKGTEAWYKQRLTLYFSLYIRQRDGECVLCFTTEELQCGHLWHRDMPATEFDTENCYALCATCNYRHEFSPRRYHDYVLTQLGERGYHDLAERAHSNIKLGFNELTILYEEIKSKVRR